MHTIDLHTHSIASPDGGLTLKDYGDMLASKRLDYIAITDHDSIVFAQEAHEKFGDVIIVGEEISTQEGDLIGLFLRELVPPGLTASQAVRRIRRQGGLVYIPHPFETMRKGLRAATLESLGGAVDIVEFFNGRAIIQNKSSAAKRWAEQHTLPGAASSDAHGPKGWGKTATVVDEPPSAANLTSLLGNARFVERQSGLRAALYPKLNRFKKRWGRA
jgi:hypothetical protein